MRTKLFSKFIFLTLPLHSIALSFLVISCGAETARQKAAPCEESSGCSNKGAPGKTDTGNANPGDSPESSKNAPKSASQAGSIAGKKDGSGNTSEIKLDGCSTWKQEEQSIPGTNIKFQILSTFSDFAEMQSRCKDLPNGPWRLPKSAELTAAKEAKAFGNALNSMKDVATTQKRNLYCGIWVGDGGANSTTGAQGFLFSAFPPGAGSTTATATADLTAVQKTDKLGVICIKE